MTYVRWVIMRLPIIGSMADEIIFMTYIAVIVLALPQIINRTRISDIAFGIITVAICLINIILFPSNASALEENLPTFLFYTFPLYYVGLSMDYKKFYPWLYWLSIITIIAYSARRIFVAAPMDDAQSQYQGDMWEAYNMLPHVCVVVLAALKKPAILNTMVSTVGIIMLASLGSRGPLLCLLIMMSVYLMLYKKYKRPNLSKVIILVVAAVILVYLDNIMIGMRDIAENMGLSVRVFDLYLEGEIAESRERAIIRKTLMRMIKDNPVFGYGLYSDYTAVGIYAHNIVLELLLTFGVIAGGGLFSVLIILLLKALITAKRSDSFAIIILPLFASGFIKLFLSGSYMSEINLFLLLGICISEFRINRKAKA